MDRVIDAGINTIVAVSVGSACLLGASVLGALATVLVVVAGQ